MQSFNEPPRAPRPMRWPGILAIVIVVGGAFALFSDIPQQFGYDGESWRFVTPIVVLAMLVAGLAHHAHKIHVVALHLAAWGGLFVLVILGYSFRYELAGLRDRVVGELLPHRALTVGEGVVAIRAGSNGHFDVEVEVEGTPLRFMVDTGASEIALSRRHAEQIGLDLQQLNFSQRVRTANGMTLAAPIRLKELRLGPIVMRDVSASVVRNMDGPSLLGMNFLDRLSSYEVSNGVLTLRR
jgi:aspartyl protease family protein